MMWAVLVVPTFAVFNDILMYIGYKYCVLWICNDKYGVVGTSVTCPIEARQTGATAVAACVEDDVITTNVSSGCQYVCYL